MSLPSRPSSHSRRLLIGLVFAGALARVATVPLPGTGDLRLFAAWMAFASVNAPTSVYGVGGWPPSRQLMYFDGTPAAVDYPPVAVVALSATGRLWRALVGEFTTHAAARVPIKALEAAACAALSWLIWFAPKRRGRGSLASMAYWANPAVIISGTVLGYLDSLAALPAIASVFAAASTRPWLGGVLFAIGVMTKPQAALVLPAVILALVSQRDEARTRLRAGAIGAAAAGFAILLPFALAGSLANLMMSLTSLVTDGALSAQGANLWWLVGYGIWVPQLFGTEGAGAFIAEIPKLSLAHLGPISIEYRGRSITFLLLLALNYLAVLAVAAWATWRSAASNDEQRRIALAAFVAHAYFTLALQVHENHLYLALPLLAIAAAAGRPYSWLLAGVSAVVSLNLNLFYGLGEGFGYAIPRSITGIDATVLLAAFNVALFIWHARIFARQCGPRRPRLPT